MKNQNFWKFLAFFFLISTIGLAYYTFSAKKQVGLSEISIADVKKEDFEELKKQNPQFAPDNNDYFYKNQTEIKFLKDLYDYDTIKEGVELKETIKYINTGKEPFFITDVKVSCGCTIPSYDNEPVKPGDTGRVEVLFKSKGKDGFSMNKLSLFGNIEKSEKSTYFKVFISK